MNRLLPRHLRPIALLLGVPLSAVVVLSESRLAAGAALAVLALALLAFEGPAVWANVEDDLD